MSHNLEDSTHKMVPVNPPKNGGEPGSRYTQHLRLLLPNNEHLQQQIMKAKSPRKKSDAYFPTVAGFWQPVIHS